MTVNSVTMTDATHGTLNLSAPVASTGGVFSSFAILGCGAISCAAQAATTSLLFTTTGLAGGAAWLTGGSPESFLTGGYLALGGGNVVQNVSIVHVRNSGSPNQVFITYSAPVTSTAGASLVDIPGIPAFLQYTGTSASAEQGCTLTGSIGLGWTCAGGSDPHLGGAIVAAGSGTIINA